MASTIDFRRLDEGFGGKTTKRKREAKDAAALSTMDIDDAIAENPAPKRAAVSSAMDPNKPIFGRPTYDGVIAGKVSGRKWKQPRKQRSSAMAVTRVSKSLEDRNREREIKKAFKERKEGLKEEIRSHKVEKRKIKEEREKKKKENILKSGTKFQKVSNPKTLKKISNSKNRKQLRVVPDHLVK